MMAADRMVAVVVPSPAVSLVLAAACTYKESVSSCGVMSANLTCGKKTRAGVQMAISGRQTIGWTSQNDMSPYGHVKGAYRPWTADQEYLSSSMTKEVVTMRNDSGYVIGQRHLLRVECQSPMLTVGLLSNHGKYLLWTHNEADTVSKEDSFWQWLRGARIWAGTPQAPASVICRCKSPVQSACMPVHAQAFALPFQRTC